MNKQISQQLWMLKFCLKIIYPKYNLYTFLVFLAIKFRSRYNRKIKYQGTMEGYILKTIPIHLQKHILEEHVDNDNISMLFNKCLIISKNQFLELCSENIFYIDNGVLWVSMKLAPEISKNPSEIPEKLFEAGSKYNFNLMTSEIHKKLWADKTQIGDVVSRIVPLVGSKLVEDDVVYTLETEVFNILSSLGLQTNSRNKKITLHPIVNSELAPKIAVSAEVNLIVNDYDLSNDFIKEILSNHFETPKLLTVNDVFCVDLHSAITGRYHYKYLDLIESVGKLYFRCKKLMRNEPSDIDNHNTSTDVTVQETLFIVKGNTQLILGENIHMLKPKDEYFKIGNCTKNESIISPKLCPIGLRNQFDQIQETILPFINGDINSLSTYTPSPIIPVFLLTGILGSGRHLLTKILAKYNGLNYIPVDCNGLQSSTAKQTESRINALIQKAKAAAPAIIVLDHFEVFAVDPENNEDCRLTEYFTNTLNELYQNYTKHPIIFIALTDKTDLKPNILRIFLEKFHMTRLNVQQRYEVLEWMSSVMQLHIDGEEFETTSSIECSKLSKIGKHAEEVLTRVAAKTDTFLYGDIDTLMHFAVRESYLKQHNIFNQLPPDPDLLLVKEEDFISALESIRSLQSHHLDAPKIPKVYWEDIGGLDNLKRELLKTIEFPIKYSHLFKNSSLKRSGILLYGPPGCGKTLVAKAVSTELNVSFLSVKGPELLNMYIGQSEENVRKVFESARASSPCIVFLDELDALAPRRGAAGDAGGASDRVVSQLLAELDGVTSGEDTDTNSYVFIMGATNRPDLLEQSLLRPGRLDKLIYVGPYTGMKEKTSVLNALCRSYKLSSDVDLTRIVEALPERCTGADMLHIVSTARSAAVRDLVRQIDAGEIKESELSPDSIVLNASDLWQGVETFRPSVTDEELLYYESLQSRM